MNPVSLNSDLEVVPPLNKPEPPIASIEDGPTTAKIRLLWESRQLIFRVACWGLLAATLIAFLVPKEYESTTRLMPPDDQSSTGLAMFAAMSSKMQGGLGGLGADVLGLKSSGALFTVILRSDTVENHLVDKFDLRKVYWKKHWDSARQRLAANTAIAEDRKSGVITITVTDKSPQRAAAMAEEYIVELNAVVSQLNTSSAHRERVFLEQRLQQVKQDLEAAEKDFSEFASRTGAIDIKQQGAAMVTAAATLQGQLIAAQSELEGLRQIYADSNVRVRSLKARVDELKSQLDKVGGKDDLVKDATNPKDDSLYPSIRKLPLLGVSYADLYRRTKVQEAVFESLTQEYELAKVSEAKEMPSVKVLDPAEVPERKSFPPRLLIMGAGATLAFVLAGTWVLGQAQWKTIHPQTPHKELAQEMLQTVNAQMPWSTPNGSRFQAASHKVWTRLFQQNQREEKDKQFPLNP